MRIGRRRASSAGACCWRRSQPTKTRRPPASLRRAGWPPGCRTQRPLRRHESPDCIAHLYDYCRTALARRMQRGPV